MARILIVDDSPTELHVMRNIVEKNGYVAVTAATAEEGIELAKKIKPDLILMDIVMPGINGFQATRQLSRAPETSTIPIIMVTTKNQETDKVWAQRQGAKDYIVKPVKEATMVKKVQALLGG